MELVKRGYGQNVESINGVKREINELLHREEVFWQQRSRSIWLSARDKNTRFFHQRASQRRRKNNIEGLHDSDETWHIDSDRIAKIAKDYYRQLFTSSNPTNMEGVLDVVDRVVTDEMAHSLIQPYIEDEVRVALFQMHPSKSLGPGWYVSFLFFLNFGILLDTMLLQQFYLCCTLGDI